MGMLAFGAMAGVGDEYVKQSGEERKNKFQEIRDKRLAEIQKEGRIHSSELATTENMRQEGVSAAGAEIKAKADLASGNADRALQQQEIDLKGPSQVSTPAGGESGHYEKQPDGSFAYISDVDQPNKPTAESTKASLEAAKTVHRMKANGEKGASTTWKELQEQYLKDPSIMEDVTEDDGFGGSRKIKRRLPGSPEMTEYINNQLHPDDRFKTNDLAVVKLDPNRMWEHAQTLPQFNHPNGPENAKLAILKIHDWWEGPPKGDPLDDPTVASPDPLVSDPSKPIGQLGSPKPGARPQSKVDYKEQSPKNLSTLGNPPGMLPALEKKEDTSPGEGEMFEEVFRELEEGKLPRDEIIARNAKKRDISVEKMKKFLTTIWELGMTKQQKENAER